MESAADEKDADMPDVGKRRGGDLFIVDNSISGWTALRYLQEWADLAESMDIATGFFEIGALLGLDGQWQKLDKIRILMGDEVGKTTKALLLQAVRSRATIRLDESLEFEKVEDNPFLHGVDAIENALRSGQIECRVYNKEKFHAKTYITHATKEVIGARALVGSSNFTRPGMQDNVELNIQVQSGGEVAQLQEWFDQHWEKGVDVEEDIIKVLTRHTHAYTPFDVYSRALHERFRGYELSAEEWEETQSKMFPQLDRYQKEAYWGLLRIAREHDGAFLCDGVGLGKTFVGLMLIERLILHEGKRVVLFAPKGAKESVWEPHLADWLPHIGGVGGSQDFSNLAVFSHTDLSRKAGGYPERFERLSELADAVIIDEAHHFRNPGSRGDPDRGRNKSRYYELYDFLDGSVRAKKLYMLTATPINNRLTDFRHMVELFSRRDERYFARTLGVNNLRAYFNRMEKELRASFSEDIQDLGENIIEANQFLSCEDFFQSIVIQRSRAYARESQLRENKTGAVFPERKEPQVADYSIRRTYGHLLDLIEQAFKKTNPLFSLPIYYPLAYYIGEDESIDPLEEGRQKQIVGLIRTQFLKRFESSVYAFELSSDRLMRKLLAFLEIHCETEVEKKRLDRWKQQNGEILHYATLRQRLLWDDDEIEEIDEDIIPEEFLEDVAELSREEYDVVKIIDATFDDLDQIAAFLAETRKFTTEQDDKLRRLIRLIKTKDLADKKVIIFTEFADTARYLKKELDKAGIDGTAQIDSATKGDRADFIKRFSPYYNGSTSAELKKQKKKEIRVLVSTDILAEGLNLQDATRLINYDIHWNPVRLMQRIGRIDRRINPAVEKKIVQDHPEQRETRGEIIFWNFLPPDELNTLLTLYKRVTQKTLMISATLGIESKLISPEDDFQALKEFNQTYEGEKTAIEQIHLDYQELLEEFPELADYLDELPGGIFSGRKRLSKGARGVFFCYELPKLDKEKGEFTVEEGKVNWYLYDIEKDQILEDVGEIVESIQSRPNTPRKCTTEESSLLEIRKKIRLHIKDGYLKQINAPIGVEPVLKCWMELNEG